MPRNPSAPRAGIKGWHRLCHPQPHKLWGGMGLHTEGSKQAGMGV